MARYRMQYNGSEARPSSSVIVIGAAAADPRLLQSSPSGGPQNRADV